MTNLPTPEPPDEEPEGHHAFVHASELLPHLESTGYQDLMRACRFANTLTFLMNSQMRMTQLEGTDRNIADRSGFLLTMSYMHELLGQLNTLYPNFHHYPEWTEMQALLNEPTLKVMKHFFSKVRRKAGFHFDRQVFTDSLELLLVEKPNISNDPKFVVEENSGDMIFSHHYPMVDLFAVTFALKANLPTKEEILDLCRRYNAPEIAFTEDLTTELAMKFERSRAATTVLAALSLSALRVLVQAVHEKMDAEYRLGARS